VAYAVAANTGTSRTAALTIAGQIFTFAQSGTSSLYTISASAGTGGSISPSGSVVVYAGTNQTFRISPNSGYRLAGVAVDGVSVGVVTSYTFTNVRANHSISANFTRSGGSTITTISVSPSSASVAVNGTQQFTATANDQSGNALSPQPSLTWTISGGGTISASGLFSAGGTAGEPFTVTASSGGVSGTAGVTVVAAGSLTIGQTAILNPDNSGDGNALVAEQVSLGQTATIISMSFYVTTAAGNLRLGIYDATGPNGGPGQLKAQTTAFTAVSGWNTQNVVSQVKLPAGNYWLAYLPSSNSLGFKTAPTGSARYYAYTYGPLPVTFSRSSQSGAYTWSFYATLQTGP
jgi:hypothetical protein